MTLMWTPPRRNLALTRANDRDLIFTFENMNGPTVPLFSNMPGTPQHPLYQFPQGTTFKFRAKDEYSDIVKDGDYNFERKEVKVSFFAEDTTDIKRDRNIYYEMDAFYPDGQRYTILVGEVVITATRNLNG